MFCEKCGAKLEEDAAFCTKCGAKISGEQIQPENLKKTEDTKIQLTVKPKFKFAYLTLPGLIVWLIFIVIIAAIIEYATIREGEKGIGVFLGTVSFVVILVIYAIKVAFQKTQYRKLTYDFYRTKVIFEDSFMNLAQKEVKYRYIREVTMSQTFIQRWFNLGNIVLYTNAETGYGNGISIVNVENVREVYKQIKDIINV